MGLSASQAKLLSITARLSDNELRSQAVTTAKMSLANRTKDASSEYMDALNSTRLLYSTYDSDGNKVQEKLTGHSLSYYGELKNQYGLVNKHNQILVSETDSKNYEDSANLMEFLDKYGVLSEPGKGDFIQVLNPEWDVVWGEYEEGYSEWKTREPNPEDDKYHDKSSGTDDELYRKFISASEPCYSKAITGSLGCYKHVLAHLMLADFGNINGKQYTSTMGGIVTMGQRNIPSNINTAGKTPDMLEVSKEIFAADPPILAAVNEKDKQELMDIMNNPDATEQEKYNKQVMSNYYIDENGQPQLKELVQKIIDMCYVIDNGYRIMGLQFDPDMKNLLLSFQQDMETAFQKDIFLKDLYNADRQKWLEQEPAKPDIPYYIDKEVKKIVNKDKAQWYVNLWHRMNGSSDDKAGVPDADGNIVTGGTTEDGLPMYKVLEDGLMNSSDWLQYALNNGTVSLERVDFTDPTEDGTGLADVTWKSIIWTNASDISEEENEAAITRAEVKYKQAMTDIEAKDKQFDNRLKLLDTEHNALQTEYDSVKTVIDKNIERTLKIYS